MAKLRDIRSDIVPAVPDEPTPASVVGVVEEDPGDDDYGFDDDDFWEALDLIEGSYKMLCVLLRVCRMSTARKRLVENHTDDLKQFIDEFTLPADEEAS